MSDNHSENNNEIEVYRPGTVQIFEPGRTDTALAVRPARQVTIFEKMLRERLPQTPGGSVHLHYHEAQRLEPAAQLDQVDQWNREMQERRERRRFWLDLLENPASWMIAILGTLAAVYIPAVWGLINVATHNSLK